MPDAPRTQLDEYDKQAQISDILQLPDITLHIGLDSLLLFPIQIRMSSGIGHCEGKGFLVFFPNEKPVGL